MKAAIDTDLGDFFRFEIQRTSPLQEAAKGRRIHLVAYLGARYATFHDDVVVGTAKTGNPQAGPPLTPLRIPGLVRPDYRLFPLPDHIADKLCAIIEIHDHGDGATVSTRVKDLANLALIATTQQVAAAALTLAVRVGTAHRRLPPPAHFTVPDLELWRRGYPARAKEAATTVPDFETAVRTRGRTPGPCPRRHGPRHLEPRHRQLVPSAGHVMRNRSRGENGETIFPIAPTQTDTVRRRPTF